MSRLAVCVLVLALAFASGAPEGDAGKQLKDDIITCVSQPADYVLSSMQVTDEGHYLGKSSFDVVYPPDGEPESNVINCIMVKDLKPEIGATATITNGTVGSTRISIHLESGFTKGLSFSIKLLGQSVA